MFQITVLKKCAQHWGKGAGGEVGVRTIEPTKVSPWKQSLQRSVRGNRAYEGQSVETEPTKVSPWKQSLRLSVRGNSLRLTVRGNRAYDCQSMEIQHTIVSPWKQSLRLSVRGFLPCYWHGCHSNTLQSRGNHTHVFSLDITQLLFLAFH